MYYPAGDESSDSSDDDFFMTPAISSHRSSGPRQPWAPSYSNRRERFNDSTNNNPAQDVKMESPELEKILERTKKNVRAVLMASKDQLELCNLEHEYYDMYEENIPYRKLQCTSLEEFLRSIPSVCWVRPLGYTVLVSAVTDQNTDHIRQMVTMTKRARAKGKKKKGGSRGGGGYSSYGGYSGYRGQIYRPPPPPPPLSSSRSIKKIAPAPVKKEEELVSRKTRLAETKEKSVWVGRLRSLLTGRQFGLLLVKLEKTYEKEWAESLPEDGRTEVRSEADIIIQDDGVKPVTVKMEPAAQTTVPVPSPGGVSGKQETAPSSGGVSEKKEIAASSGKVSSKLASGAEIVSVSGINEVR